MKHIALIMMIAIFATGCKKASGPVNFTCTVNGNNKLQGTAFTYYNNAIGVFQVVMNGPNGESTSLNWYGINTISQESNITARTYTIPAIALPPLVLTGTFQYASNTQGYSTGNGRNLGGTITITQNTGPGGLISGTYSFNALNTSPYAFDTVYVTEGSFTNVKVVSQ